LRSILHDNSTQHPRCAWDTPPNETSDEHLPSRLPAGGQPVIIAFRAGEWPNREAAPLPAP
ncbi:MAG: hypothetical protein JJ992_10485, partial [Planctomycetes bacterium]|nr:hypothetical protein [Planctomycetota bacterium]